MSSKRHDKGVDTVVASNLSQAMAYLLGVSNVLVPRLNLSSVL